MSTPVPSPPTPQVWTIGKLLELSAQFLASKKIPQARLEAEILLAHVLGFRRIELYMHIDESVADVERGTLRDLVKRRSERCPCAYLVGYKEFHLHRFKVSKGVLIPRPETELLAEEAIRLLEENSWTRVLDLGTGSGILAITIAKAVPKSTCVAIDISSEALDIAKENATTLGATERIEFRQASMVDALSDLGTFDVVVSNPPYIPGADIAKLESDVRDYEPRLALDGGPDGLDLVRSIISKANRLLNPGGIVLIEIGAGQAPAVEQLIQTTPGLELLPTKSDLVHIPRVVSAKRPLE